MDLRGDDGTPVLAASLEEILRLQERADIPTVSRYEAAVRPCLRGQDHGVGEGACADAISAEEFERVWLDARRTLGVTPTAPNTDR
ncbi:hypothetical protein GCM10017687_04650 [Streptomyces echinatus]